MDWNFGMEGYFDKNPFITGFFNHFSFVCFFRLVAEMTGPILTGLSVADIIADINQE